MWNEDKSDYRYALLVCAPSKRLLTYFSMRMGITALFISIGITYEFIVHFRLPPPPMASCSFFGVKMELMSNDVKTLVVFHECALELK